MTTEPASEHDRAVVAEQLGRVPRAMRAVAHRCPCGLPDVVESNPRTTGGVPFPTTFYLTCPTASSEIGRLESTGIMREMTARVQGEAELGRAYAAAHEAYLAHRAALAQQEGLGDVPEIEGVSAGGMPNRVKCLHALVGHALAAGPGVNPIGDEALQLLPPWWTSGPCVSLDAEETS